MKLGGKRAVVTGAAKGIGAAICRHLVGEGAKVVINYQSSVDEAQQLAEELNRGKTQPAAFTVQADVAEEDEVSWLVRESVQRLGGIDILINNAGVESTVSALDLPMEEWDRVMNVNLRGAFMCAKAAAVEMIKQGKGGVILNNSSIHERVSRLGLSHYVVSKAGLRMLTQALALEWATFGIRVLAVAPGAIETEMNREEIAAFGKDKFETWIPLQRLGTVDDVAASVTFFVSDEASYITGVSLTIDGGYLLNLVRYDPRKEAGA